LEDIEQLLKTAFTKMERLLGDKTVAGEPVQIGDSTVIPLFSIGFGFGAGLGLGNLLPNSALGAGGGSGMGGGAAIVPVAVAVVTPQGVRVEPILAGNGSALEKIAETVCNAALKPAGDVAEDSIPPLS